MQPNSFEDALITRIVGEAHERYRLDVYLADEMEDASRSFIKKLIKDGRVTVNGGVCTRPGRTMTAGDKVAVEIPPPPVTDLRPEDIPIEILYEDQDVVVVNKPAGLVVHPAPGHYTGTLLNAILYHCADFQRPGADPARPGIVHRIDRDTSGVLVIAKTPSAFAALSEQARAHTFDRRYLALVRGEFKETRGRITASIGRSMADPARMAVTGIGGRDAVTRFEVMERFGVASLLSVQLETGRTHQIRVHLRFAGHPILGDPVYGITDYESWKLDPEARAALGALHGQALHAERLGFTHPATGQINTFAAPVPADFMRAVDALRRG